jgi:hypothetical protein
MKIPDDDRDYWSPVPSEASDATGLTISSAGGVEATSSAANKDSDAIRAVLMYHLRARRLQVRTALKEAVQEKNASEILKLYCEAEAVGVAQAEIDEALAVAAEICAPSAYDTVMQGGSAVDIIHCLGCVSHLSREQTAQLEMRLGEEASFLIQKGDWRCARDLLLAAEIAGVSSLRDANGEKTVGLMIEETYAAEAMEGTHADPLVPILWPSASMNLMHNEDKPGSSSHLSISRASTAASDSLTLLESESAAAC